MPFIAPVHGAKVFNSCEEKPRHNVGRCFPSLTESPRAPSRSSGVVAIGLRRRLPRSSSELADVGARPEFTLIESQVSTPRHKLTGARRGFFFAESGQPRHCGRQTIGRAPASLMVKAFARRRTIESVCRITIDENGRRTVRLGSEIHRRIAEFQEVLVRSGRTRIGSFNTASNLRAERARNRQANRFDRKTTDGKEVAIGNREESGT